MILTDSVVGPLYLDRLERGLHASDHATLSYEITAGEASKSLSVAGAVYEFLAVNGVSRDAVLLALGGGVVSDLGGFVASTWMRGIRFTICPTTLEADVDASIGGKTGVNLPFGKNLVGAFHQPSLVVVDPGCLRTLQRRDVVAGLAESVKHAVIASDEFLEWHLAHAAEILSLESDTVEELIRRNIRIKADFVQRDAQEALGVRAFLNFGHTIGHAIEACCEYRLRHGECVAIGMVAACRLSKSLGLLDAAGVDRICALLSRFGLPTRLTEPVNTDEIMSIMGLDKKRRRGVMRFVLLEGIGRPVLKDDLSDRAIRAAFESVVT